MDLVITAFDLVENRTRFFKPWKAEYAQLALRTAVLASCAVPTYFPVVAGRFVDGGVGSYGNPCYLAAFELQEVLRWHPAETTLISVGTGRAPSSLHEGEAERLWPWDWIGPALGAFQHSADDQQVHLVDTFTINSTFGGSRSICAHRSRWTTPPRCSCSPSTAMNWAARCWPTRSSGRWSFARCPAACATAYNARRESARGERARHP